MRNGTRLIKMKKPWGTETFKGDYSDSRMSSSVQRELGHTKGNDGVFYMSLDQYYDQVKKSTMMASLPPKKPSKLDEVKPSIKEVQQQKLDAATKTVES